MKKIFLFCSLFAIIISIVYSIESTAEKYNRLYFKIKPEDRKILLPVVLNDSITTNMIFDSGTSSGTFILDSTFCAAHQSIKSKSRHKAVVRVGSAWSPNSVSSSLDICDLAVKIGNSDLIYKDVTILNWIQSFYTSYSKGLFNIPQNDTTHVWELNFENNFLEIHSKIDFKMPEDCFIAPIVINENKSYTFNIQLPLKIKCISGDTLTLNRIFLIDTGLPDDVALTYNAPELSFFNKQDNAVWLSNMDSYRRYYNVKATAFDGLIIDSLRIYTHDYSNKVKANYVIGLNFLKRFNVFFDIKNRQIGLQPIKNYQRIINPIHRRFYYSVNKTPKGKFIIKFITNDKDNYYKSAGLRQGDEIIALNGKKSNSITPEEFIAFRKLDTLIFDIIRMGKPMKIVVKVNLNVKQGD